MHTHDHRYYLGKTDAGRAHGRRLFQAYVTWRYDGTCFTMSGEIWNSKNTDIIEGGQCLETLSALFPHDSRLQRMVVIWRRWHCNDLRAGTPAQMAYLRTREGEFPGYPALYYTWAKDQLAAQGLDPDQGYAYGSRWLTEPLPDAIRAEIATWDDTPA